uniref:KH-like RNA-binding domain-containing protein n=1 Tax=Microcebus murinus TaxID=30608 RepID=A0A8C6EK03_MICMU
MGTVLRRLFAVFFAMERFSRRGFVIYIYGWPFSQTRVLLLLGTMSLQLCLRRNRGERIWGQRVDMETGLPSKKPWWTEPENFRAPRVFYLEEDQEELIFGHSDTYLHCIEVHSYTLIQLERWFTARGHTRVIAVGPFRATQWLLHMMSRVISQDSYHHAQGLKMLERVRSQPLTEDDLETPMSMDMSGTISLSAPEASPSHLAACSGFHLSSLYWG